jgi:low affinity Fe/Cu permease
MGRHWPLQAKAAACVITPFPVAAASFVGGAAHCRALSWNFGGIAGTLTGISMAKDSTAQANRAPTHTKHPLAAHFAKFAQKTSHWSGHPIAFLLALAVVLVWIVTGPIFNYSDTWQLVINTGTTIVTFLMVFLIQNTQNRDMMSMHLKLTELVLAMKGAEDKFASIEDLTDEELEELHQDSVKRAEIASKHLEQRHGSRDKTPAKRAAAHRSSNGSTETEPRKSVRKVR